MKTIRDRVVEFKRVRASEIREHGKNPNVHPDAQRKALRGILSEVGFAGAELCYYSERNGGALTLIDGALRRSELGDQEVPCVITDLTDAEADKLLLVYDPIRAMQQQDDAKINSLLSEVESEDEALNDLFDQLGKEHEINTDETELKQLDVRPPPKMSWALVGIPTVRWGEIAEFVEQIALVEGVTVETAVNDAVPEASTPPVSQAAPEPVEAADKKRRGAK